MTREEQEKKNKRTGIMVSVGLHALLAIIFSLMLAWKAPNPPLPEYGIMVNFGLDDQGSGDIQEPAPVAETQEEQEVEQAVEAEESEPVEEVVSETVEEVTESYKVESPDVVKEQPKEQVKPKKPTEKKVEEKKTETPINSAAVYKPQQGAGNDGNDKNKTGDKGNPEGTLDPRASYDGKPGGGGGGPALEITGWIWDATPNKKDNSEESGKITFTFRISADGYVTRVQTTMTTVSPAVVSFYQKQLEATTFSQTNNNPPPPFTEGKVTFYIRSK